MPLWRLLSLPSARMDEEGGVLTRFPQVSHCYVCQTVADWPYNRYGMVHAADFASAQTFIVESRRDMGIEACVMLPTVTELKKSSFVFTVD